jgi:chondroitin 4-sulfotransferase 11
MINARPAGSREQLDVSYVNNQLGFVFIHIPRTSGTSMLTAPFLQGEDRGHRSLLEVMDDPDYDPAFFSWTFVRNPYDRLVSAYFHVVECHGFTYYRDFGDFVRNDFADGAGGHAATSSRLLEHRGGHRHFVPMFDLLENREGRVGVEFLGRFENVAADWQHVCERIGVEHVPLPRENVSGTWGGQVRVDWREYYDDELAAIVSEAYRDDFDHLGYATDWRS